MKECIVGTTRHCGILKSAFTINCPDHCRFSFQNIPCEPWPRNYGMSQHLEPPSFHGPSAFSHFCIPMFTWRHHSSGVVRRRSVGQSRVWHAQGCPGGRSNGAESRNQWRYSTHEKIAGKRSPPKWSQISVNPLRNHVCFTMFLDVFRDYHQQENGTAPATGVCNPPMRTEDWLWRPAPGFWPRQFTSLVLVVDFFEYGAAWV